MSPAASEFMQLLAYLCLQHGKAARARTLLDALATLQPDDALVAQSQALATLESGDAAAALRLIEQALARFPQLEDDRPAQLIRARSLFAAGLEEEARAVAAKWTG